jgi:hypothetical protein
VKFEQSPAGRAIRIAALGMVLASAALIVDQVLFVAPRAPFAAQPMPIEAPAVTSLAGEGFSLPDSVRPSATDVVAEAPAF